MTTRILLVGCGKMGAAMLEGWLDRGLAPADVVVVDPGDFARRTFDGRVRVVGGAQDVPEDFSPDVLVLAVKPQVMADVAAAYGRFRNVVYLSIAAGKTIAFFEGLFGREAAIIRAMPNTPAAVRAGITVLCANANVTSAQRAACRDLLAAVGQVEEVADEALMDAVTAVSGSGPAYVFHMVEALAEAGRRAGLPADLALSLARATVSGAGELLRQSSEEAGTLRQNVTSPGGTTFAALQVLMREEGGLTALMSEAVEAATRRSRELAS
ncbi:pyrroline-5-carboxylate reductase [Telmatospirillum sp. J64-1]|uniref:pyrroline-5-carboxylate reductase n=1 Tax=Telmatospirillum sp. J64-1 TaxID=2502183 RepID=UPI00115D2AA2|nr:pyrroline-5-carboxylate reductase [Telmatospirillum sp. J64-1]